MRIIWTEGSNCIFDGYTQFGHIGPSITWISCLHIIVLFNGKLRLFFLIQCDHAEIGYQYELDIFGLHIPNRIPPWQIKTVKIRARVGSPRLEDTANGLRNGMTSSFAMACSKRGAPVKLCSPAPSVDKNEPTRMTHSLGHAILATTNFPPIDAPNLYAIHDKGQLIWVQIVFVMVLINMRRIRANCDWNNIWRQSNDWFNYSFFFNLCAALEEKIVKGKRVN